MLLVGQLAKGAAINPRGSYRAMFRGVFVNWRQTTLQSRDASGYTCPVMTQKSTNAFTDPNSDIQATTWVILRGKYSMTN